MSARPGHNLASYGRRRGACTHLEGTLPMSVVSVLSLILKSTESASGMTYARACMTECLPLGGQTNDIDVKAQLARQAVDERCLPTVADGD